jgi:glycosyltransferase involved in cell wall biosynthesis
VKILHMASWLEGGAGTIVPELVSLQRAAGHDVVVVLANVRGSLMRHRLSALERLRATGARVLFIEDMWKRQLAQNLKALTRIRKELGRIDSFDVIHSHAALPSVIGLLLAGDSDRRVPVIQTIHGRDLLPAPSVEDVSMLSLLARVVAPTRAAADALAVRGVAAQRIDVIPPGISPIADPFAVLGPRDDDFDAMAGAQESGRQVVCSVGTLGARKNQRLLVDALALLPPEQRPLCVFIGDGLISELVMRAELSGVGESVRVCGPRPDVRQFLRRADGLALVSTEEVLPLSLLEAYCDHVPVIASDILELSHIISDQTAIRFASNDARSLSQALVALASEAPAVRADRCAAAHSLFRRRFTGRGMANAYLAIYQEASRKASPEYALTA